MTCKVLVSFVDKLRGLLPGSDARQSSFVVFSPCHDIHTFGMDMPIDVAFANGEGVVLKVCRALPPRRRVSCPQALLTLERLKSDAPWFRVGDCVFVDLERKVSK